MGYSPNWSLTPGDVLIDADVEPVLCGLRRLCRSVNVGKHRHSFCIQVRSDLEIVLFGLVHSTHLSHSTGAYLMPLKQYSSSSHLLIYFSVPFDSSRRTQ